MRILRQAERLEGFGIQILSRERVGFVFVSEDQRLYVGFGVLFFIGLCFVLYFISSIVLIYYFRYWIFSGFIDFFLDFSIFLNCYSVWLRLLISFWVLFFLYLFSGLGLYRMLGQFQFQEVRFFIQYSVDVVWRVLDFIGSFFRCCISFRYFVFCYISFSGVGSFRFFVFIIVIVCSRGFFFGMRFMFSIFVFGVFVFWLGGTAGLYLTQGKTRLYTCLYIYIYVFRVYILYIYRVLLSWENDINVLNVLEYFYIIRLIFQMEGFIILVFLNIKLRSFYFFELDIFFENL